MNAEHLDYIVRHPASMTVQDAQELEALCQKFPYFSTPFVLLAAYYKQQGDYRAEDAAQAAALRVLDRSWLYDVVHQQAPVWENEHAPASSDLTQAQEPAETAAPEETPVDTPPVEEVVPTDIWPADPEEQTTETETHWPEDPDLMEAADETFTPSVLEPEASEEPVFEEISRLEITPEAGEIGITGHGEDEEGTMVGFEMQWDNLPDAGGLLTPMTEAELETAELTESPETVNTTAITEPEPENLRPRMIRQAAVYDIEQYFKATEPAPDAPADFYSWLKSPGPVNTENEAEKDGTATDHRDELIDRFIRTNPSISRPKKEFFTPETAAKKSEQLPDHLATETLAKVYLQQGNPQGAIRIYEKLLLKFPEKSPYFAALIDKTRKEHNL